MTLLETFPLTRKAALPRVSAVRPSDDAHCTGKVMHTPWLRHCKTPDKPQHGEPTWTEI